MSPQERIDHIERPRLPWRKDEQAVTECGLAALKAPTLTHADIQRRLKEWGKQRTAITTCMTCFETWQRYARWEDDPRKAIEREIQWEGPRYWSGPTRGSRLRDELRALAVLCVIPKNSASCSLSFKASWTSLHARRSAALPRVSTPKNRSCRR